MEKLEALLEWGGLRKDVVCLVLGGASLLVSIFGLAPGLPFDPAWADEDLEAIYLHEEGDYRLLFENEEE